MNTPVAINHFEYALNAEQFIQISSATGYTDSAEGYTRLLAKQIAGLSATSSRRAMPYLVG